jgi:type IV secretion system protein VirB8
MSGTIGKRAKPKGKKRLSNIGGPLDEQRNWYQDRYQYALVQRNVLAMVALLSLFIALFAAITSSQLSPQKSVKPFIIQIDDKTGITQAVDPQKYQEISANESLKRYFIAQYIRARETYDPATNSHDIESVRVMSSPEVFEGYKEYISPKNPESPVNLFEDKSKRVIRFKSLTFLMPDVAQARISAVVQGDKERKYPEEHRIVVVKFEFVKLDLNLQERLINPLGFRVVSYRESEEIISQ